MRRFKCRRIGMARLPAHGLPPSVQERVKVSSIARLRIGELFQSRRKT